MKLTNSKYELPVLIALEPIKEFGTGANKPVLMRCVHKGNGDRVEVVVKLRDGERMKDGMAHGRELMGSWLAREMNILVPEPYVVEIKSDLHESLKGKKFYQRIKESVGLNFGCQNLENMIQPDTRSDLKRSHIIDIQRILLFDLMTINPDRTSNKVNMLSDNESVFAIDHELAFITIPIMLPPRSEPWILNSGDVYMVENGIIKNLIQGKMFDVGPFVRDIESIKSGFWTKSQKLIPNEWDWELWDEVPSFIMKIVNNAEEFVDNTKRILT